MVPAALRMEKVTDMKDTYLYRALAELNIWNNERKRFLADFHVPEGVVPNADVLKKDYIKAFYRHRVTFSEYFFQYRFHELSEKEREEFVSVSSMQRAYRRLIKPEVRDLFHIKPRFLELWSEFIKRDWIVVTPEISFETFRDFITSHDVIMKIPTGTRGAGIRKIGKGEKIDYEQLYEDCLTHKILVEECIAGDRTVQEFHPASLNTIRILTFRVPGDIIIAGAFLRVGRGGNIIDNAHAGGIFSQINIGSGIIESDGIDVDGNHYKVHPETGKAFKGFAVPKWEECKETCMRAMSKYENVIVAGWDVCINSKGRIEIIEGNHAPDIDVMQSPLRVGKKRFYQEILNNYNIRL